MESMAKVKVSVTIEEEFMRWVDEEIKKLRFRNRSHALEYALAKLIEAEEKREKR